jgi:hypothetical protein
MQNLVEIITSSVVLAGDNGAELTLTIPVLGSRILQSINITSDRGKNKSIALVEMPDTVRYLTEYGMTLTLKARNKLASATKTVHICLQW